MRGPKLDIKQAIADRMAKTATVSVWTPADFLDLGPREAVDQALHRLVVSKSIRRVVRGFYDVPQLNRLTGKLAAADYRAIIAAVARRDKVRIVLDGITAANDLRLTDAVPARVTVFTDARLQPIKLGNLTIQFKHAAPSKLYWADRPAMRVVQALYWLKDMISPNRDRSALFNRLNAILADPVHGEAIRDDLRSNLSVLPEWMQKIVRELLVHHPKRDQDSSGSAKGRTTRRKKERVSA